MPMFKRGCVVLILISAWACAAGQLKDGVRFYGGEPRAVSDIAILATQYEEYGRLWLRKLDGMTRRYGLENREWNTAAGGICVELLPGEHTLEFQYYSGNHLSSVERSHQNQVVVFTAKPGTLYRAHANKNGNTWVASVREDGPIPPAFQRPKQVFVPK